MSCNQKELDLDVDSVNVDEVLVIECNGYMYTVDRQEALRWFGDKGPRLLDWHEMVNFLAFVRPISRRPNGASEEQVFSRDLLERGAEAVKIC